MKVIKLDCPACGTAGVVLDLEAESFDDRMNRIERDIIVQALDQAGGNAALAARSLQMEVHAMRWLIGKHGLKK